MAYTLTTPRGTYEVEAPLARGDLSVCYRGRATAGAHAGREVVLKLADGAANNDLLLEEARVLGLLYAVQSPQHKQLPALLDTCETPDGRVALALSLVPGLDVLALRRRFPQGIPPRHLIWILRRLLSVLGFAHQQGILHGNVEPAHIVVSAPDHNVVLLDWTCALVAPARSGQGFRWHNPTFSAPEVALEQPPVPASDLFSVGRCAVYLLGGDLETNTLPPTVDERLARLVGFLVRVSPLQRARDAWEMFAEVNAVRAEIWGAHRFEEFVIPPEIEG